MNCCEVGSIVFGLSIGFVVLVGIFFILKIGLFNVWLFFFFIDIFGVLVINSLMVFGFGVIWGVLIFICLLLVD